MMKKFFSLFLLMSLVIFACSHEKPELTLLEDFFHDYIVRADAKAALRLSVGSARQKLENEIPTVIGEPHPVELPHVTYTILAMHNHADTTTYDLLLKIEETQASPFTRELLVSESAIEGKLKVVDFEFVN